MGADAMPSTISARAARFRVELDAAYAAHPELPAGLLEAVGDRETLWTEAPEYRLADGTQARGRPDGTGDWDPRNGKMPPDGLGWGRGPMQVDLAAHPKFCAETHGQGGWRWACARCNIAYAAGVLAAGLQQADGYLPEAICAYNAGWGGVKRARSIWRGAGGIALLPTSFLDAQTTRGNYVSDVLRRQQEYLRETALQPAIAGKET